tara:strand:- start:20276 stop:20620 length:345 start_codon:yes stop_codon:yes gene_type:complete
MKRDSDTFPDDDCGNALWNMAQAGDNLAKRRDVEFTVIFSTEDAALKFGAALLFNRQQVLLCDNEASTEYPFEIVATVSMVPSHPEITDYENLLQVHASSFSGIYDGWGSFPQS